MSAMQLAGQRFGRLVAQEIAGKDRKGYHVWACVCDCGRRHHVVSSVLACGKSRSCGCLRRERAANLYLTRQPERADA